MKFDVLPGGKLCAAVTTLIENLGYSDVAVKGPSGICAVYRYMFTGGLVIDIDAAGHRGRYCFPTFEEAQDALASWDGYGDPDGAWIKYKGAREERLGPGCVDDEWGAHSIREEHAAAPKQRSSGSR